MKRLGLQNTAVANKWTDAMNQNPAQFFAKEYISVVGANTQPMHSSEFVKMTSNACLHLAYELGRDAFEKFPDAEGVYIGGEAWLTLPVIGRLEAEFGKPVITNQVATVLHVLNLLDTYPGVWQVAVGKLAQVTLSPVDG